VTEDSLVLLIFVDGLFLFVGWLLGGSILSDHLVKERLDHRARFAWLVGVELVVEFKVLLALAQDLNSRVLNHVNGSQLEGVLLQSCLVKNLLGLSLPESLGLQSDVVAPLLLLPGSGHRARDLVADLRRWPSTLRRFIVQLYLLEIAAEIESILAHDFEE